MIFRRNLIPLALGISVLTLVLDLRFSNPALTATGLALAVLLAGLGLGLSSRRHALAAAEAEQAAGDVVRNAERRMERASLWSLEGHWELDLVRGTRWQCPSFQSLLGYERRELSGSLDDAIDQTHPDDRYCSAEAFADRLQSDSPADVCLRLRVAAGSYRWFRLRGSAERDSGGRVVRLAGTAQDVHEQQLAQDGLREAQARFERAVHGTQDGLFEIDLTESPGRGWLSARVHELLGFEDGELGEEVNALRDREHPDDLPMTDAAVQVQHRSGETIDNELRMRTKAGEYRWYRIRAIPTLDSTGRVTRVSGSLQDVHAAHVAREALVGATEAAQMASRAKSAFLATMSHEIRTPMNGVIGMTALLLDTPLGREQREYAEAIRASSSSLLAIINDILDFSKIEAGKLEIESLEMDLRGNVEEVGSMMAPQAAMKGLELVVDVHPDVPHAVLGDPQRIRQCLMNLIGNAVKFTLAGEIVLTVSSGGRRDGAAIVRFEVRDTGIGMTPQTCAGLFDAFTQADSSTARQFGGTGLGLSIVKRLAELMGGDVGVQSELGSGSVFWLTLPVTRIEPSGRSRRLALEGRGRRILIVDDSPASRRVLTGQLEPYGFGLDAVGDAAAALERLKGAAREGRPYDVVLVDLQMPDVDGAMLAERIVADPALAGSRRVLLAPLDRKADPERFAAMGFAAYLTKPVRSRELRECLQHVLAHDAQEWAVRTLPAAALGASPTAADPPPYRARVLVVEDNPVNQKVAHKFVERLGCTVTVACDGAEALDHCARERFDLILMDMQMPVLDGLEATREIRARESGRSRTPIVGLTANVLPGQFQTCIDAGMDDVLGKPIDPGRLREVLERFVLRMPASSPSPVEPPAMPEPAGVRAALDLERLGALAGGDAEFVRELLATFRASATAAIAGMNAAVAGGARERLAREAHKLKGASDNVGATRLSELAAWLEAAADDAHLAELGRRVAEIGRALVEIEEMLVSEAMPAALVASRR